MSEEQRAEGSHLIDTNGRRFIDYALPARADARTDGWNTADEMRRLQGWINDLISVRAL